MIVVRGEPTNQTSSTAVVATTVATVVQANSLRASRAARPPEPTNTGVASAIDRAVEDAFRAMGMTFAPNPLTKPRHLMKTNSCGGRRRRTNHATAHLMSLHSRSVDSANREPSWLSYTASLPLANSCLMQAAIRSSSVRISLVTEKAQRLSGAKMGSSQQTTRINCQPICSAHATQSIAVLVALGAAHSASDPRSSFGLRPRALLNPPEEEAFVVASTSRLLPNSLVPFTVAGSLLATLKEVAADEIKSRVISAEIHQDKDSSLPAICNRIVSSDGSSAGDEVWASFALLSYLIHEPRGREIVRRYRITDFCAHVSETFLAYGRAEITRRARLSDTQILQGLEPQRSPALVAAVEAMRASLEDENIEAEIVAAVEATGGHNNSSDDESAQDSCATATRTRTAPPKSTTSLTRMDLGSDRQVLSAKRKRSAISHGTAALILDYWNATFNSSHAHVLLMLITSSRSAAQTAAETTIFRQLTEPPDSHIVLDSISKDSAIRSAQALRCLVRQEDAPRILAWRTRRGGRTKLHVGIARSHADLQHTALHACRTPPLEARPPAAAGVALAWTDSVHTGGQNEFTSPLIGAFETMVRAEEPREGKRGMGVTSRFRAMLKGQVSPTHVTGITRSVITFRTRLVASESQLSVGKRIAERMKAVKKAAAEAAAHTPSHEYEVATVLADEPADEQPAPGTVNSQPLCTPSTNLALAVQASETVRILHKGKTHRADPCRAFCGLELHAGEISDNSMEWHDKPTSLLTMVDVDIDLLLTDDGKEPDGSEPPRAPSRNDARHVPAAVSVTVCGDSPIRVPEAMAMLSNDTHARAMLFFASSQASHMTEVFLMTSAGFLNAAAASAKRILLPDLNKRLFLTAWQVYRVGHRNVCTSFPTSSWSGAYGAGLEIGSSGGLLRHAAAVTSDKRQHGKVVIHQEVTDEFSIALAHRTHVQVSPKTFDIIPLEMRGVPHLAIPGLHRFLTDYTNAHEALREAAGIEACTADSLQALPFSPFAECLASGTHQDVDPTIHYQFRNPYDRIHGDGRSFQIENTLSDTSIFREPLIPRLRIVDISDNPFASVHPYADSFLNAASTIALMARRLDPSGTPEAQVARLKDCIHAFHTGSLPEVNHMVAADVSVLINCCYPTCFAVGEPQILQAYAQAAPANAAAARRNKDAGGVGIDELMLPSGLVEEARSYWLALTREHNPAWPAFAALLERLLHLDGRVDMSFADYDSMSEVMQTCLRNAWYVASPDGDAPPPVSHPYAPARHPASVTAEMLAPRVVDTPNEDGSWTDPRGAAIGMTPGALRQIYALLLGADQPGVLVQCHRNEGGLLLRPSSAADILKENGQMRSEKAISPIGVEGDQPAWGTREAKLRNVGRQRRAWTANLRLIMPLCIHAADPLPAEVRFRADRETVDFVRQRTNAYRSTGIRTHEDAVAEAVFAEAAAAAGRM